MHRKLISQETVIMTRSAFEFRTTFRFRWKRLEIENMPHDTDPFMYMNIRLMVIQ